MNHHDSPLLQGRQLCGEISCRWQAAVGLTYCLKIAPRVDKKRGKQECLGETFAIIANLATLDQKKSTAVLIAKIFNPHSP